MNHLVFSLIFHLLYLSIHMKELNINLITINNKISFYFIFQIFNHEFLLKKSLTKINHFFNKNKIYNLFKILGKQTLVLKKLFFIKIIQFLYQLIMFLSLIKALIHFLRFIKDVADKFFDLLIYYHYFLNLLHIFYVQLAKISF